MEKEIQETKNCGNCKHIMQYYVKLKNRFRSVFYGICEHKHGKKLIRIKLNSMCECWKAAATKEERAESLKTALQKISKRLDEIADVLNAEE